MGESFVVCGQGYILSGRKVRKMEYIYTSMMVREWDIYLHDKAFVVASARLRDELVLEATSLLIQLHDGVLAVLGEDGTLLPSILTGPRKTQYMVNNNNNNRGAANERAREARYLLPPPRRVCFWSCWSVCQQDNSKR